MPRRPRPLQSKPLATLLKLLPFLSAVLSFFDRLWTKRETRIEARKEVLHDIATKEAEATRDAAKVVAQHRDTSDTVKRLNNGTF